MSRMYCLCFTIITMVTAALCCMPPHPDFPITPLTPAQVINGAQHVVLGHVTSLLEGDPLPGERFGTLKGAVVSVKCSYKGGQLPRTILIEFVPLPCHFYVLEADTSYLIFLNTLRLVDGETLYAQSHQAEPAGNIQNYLGVCGLKMIYPALPKEDVVPLASNVCASEQKAEDCQQ